MCSDTYMYSTFMIIALLANPPLLPSFSRFQSPCVNEPPLFTYLEIPFLVIVVRIVLYPEKGVCADPVDKGAILGEGGGSSPAVTEDVS